MMNGRFLETSLAGSWTPQTPGLVELLESAQITALELAGEGSNLTYLARLERAGAGHGVGVYKPSEGEAPLYDFPWGSLYKREYASYLLSSFLGWPAIPLTVVRGGPHGTGTVQLFVEPKPGSNFFSLGPSESAGLQAVAAFDMVANNADRKGGHVFLDRSGKLWSIDHGLTFHEDPKLRTVIWDYAGEPVPGGLLDDLGRLCVVLRREGTLVGSLRRCLDAGELQALGSRVEALLANPVFPAPYSRRSFPRPLI